MDSVNCEKKDLYQRINYLYQAAHCLSAKSNLSVHFGGVLKTIAKRSVLKIEPKVKRDLCKSCNALLIPGITATVRLRGKRSLHYVTTCLRCSTIKRLPCDYNYRQLWCEKANQLTVEQRPKNSNNQSTVDKPPKNSTNQSPEDKESTNSTNQPTTI
ncbi:Ribonuclease P protein subunit p21 [Chamberlinius hualienensis]